jgi:hypothetical protein
MVAAAMPNPAMSISLPHSLANAESATVGASTKNDDCSTSQQESNTNKIPSALILGQESAPFVLLDA